MFICITSLVLYIDFNLHHSPLIANNHVFITFKYYWFIYDIPFIIYFTLTKNPDIFIYGTWQLFVRYGEKKTKQEWAKWYLYYSVKSDNILERLVNFCKTLLLLCRSRFMSLRPFIFYENVFCLVWVFEVISHSGQKAS